MDCQTAKHLYRHFIRIVIGGGSFEEMMVASQEIAASTAQLVIASRVKAKEGSNGSVGARDVLHSSFVTPCSGLTSCGWPPAW